MFGGILMRWDWIKAVVNGLGFTQIAELGVEEGINAIHILHGCPYLEKYIAVDKWQKAHPGLNKIAQKNEAVFRDVLKISGYDKKTTILKGKTHDMVDYVENESLDLVFIDAWHSTDAVLEDITDWLPKIKPNGIISGHDIVYRKVWRAVAKLLPDFKVWQGKEDAVWFYDLAVPSKIADEGSRYLCEDKSRNIVSIEGSDRFVGVPRDFVWTPGKDI
jgi:hypothetical protein